MNGKLELEGEYLNGKRNGKGKEYNFDNKLIFEGDYFNGNRWNGKGYDGWNNIVYKLQNGEGYVKEYMINGILTFEGSFLYGQKNGRGRDYDWNGKL